MHSINSTNTLGTFILVYAKLPIVIRAMNEQHGRELIEWIVSWYVRTRKQITVFPKNTERRSALLLPVLMVYYYDTTKKC